MIKHDRRAMLIEFLYSLLGMALILTVRHFALTSDQVLFTKSMSTVAFFVGLLGTLVARHFAHGFTTITTWFASLALFGIGISTPLIEATWQANIMLAIMALIMLDADSTTYGHGVKSTPFLRSAFVAAILTLAISI